MALVSYGSSDEEDEELAAASDNISQLSTVSKRSRKGQPVRIGLPAAPQPDSDDESEPQEKISRLKAPAGSGVASFLPKPKSIQFGVSGRRGNKGKGAVNAAEKSAQLRAQFMKKPKAEEEEQKSDDEDANIGSSSFFSLDTLGNNKDDTTAEGSKAGALSFLAAPGPQLPPDVEQYREAYPSVNEEGQSYVDPALYENDEAFKRLECGKKIKPKGQKNAVNIVDVNEQDQIVERLSLQRKMATQQKPTRPKLSQESYDSADMKFLTRMPTTDMRRKHQMTWLVHQAHEREQLLEEQWSAQRATRRQTQSKYGF
ncbi:proline-rich protein PRCC-like [Oscarella lobularis]|uniref:proline-rich protein PRCC-like n=1 Tax=Oscarella lobularis TaxID=121494 RepID=UPI0033135EE1